MEKKINIAELLKDCPKGMELDCTMYEGAELDCVTNDKKYPIKITIKDDIDGDITISLTKKGWYNTLHNPKCVIFPKGKTTWEGFNIPFKDGDIVSTKNGICIGIVKKSDNNACETYIAMDGENIVYTDNIFCFERFATEEEKQKLFDSIKENGYKWNEENKTLEKLVESKEEDTDDRLVMSGIYFDRENYADEVELHLGNYEIEIRNGKTYAIFKNQKTETLKPKFKVDDRIKDKNNKVWFVAQVGDKHFSISRVPKCEGYFVPIEDQDDYELVTPKFDITTLKPFDKVLVRLTNDCLWLPKFF